MSEAEKKWEKYDNGFSVVVPLSDASMASRHDYKAALKREIEKEKQTLLAPHYSSYDLKATQTLDKVIELLDTVEP